MIFVWAICGFLAGSLIEWLAHRHILHSLTIRGFSYNHFSIHHRNSRQDGCHDRDYLSFPPKTLDSGFSEVVFLVVAVLLALPLCYISFWLWFFLLAHACFYYWAHRKFHVNPQWGKKWLRWHWDHHMGKDQNKNWGVTTPIFDWVFGTRVHEYESKHNRQL
jgi:sterol desaturase/sphingolipid hydroxylase (fatty acid hydroxylase superfamily)